MNPYPIRPPMAPCFPSHVQWSAENSLFSPVECDVIVRAGERQQLGFATIGNGDDGPGVVSLGYRCVRSCGLRPQTGGDDLEWVFDRIAARVAAANAAYFRFDLTGLGEEIQFLKYETNAAAEPGHYHWHQDFGGGISSNRKLSLVVQLSDVTDYDGCRLQLMNERVWEVPYTAKGNAIIFPSWTPHQVTDITRGTRYALAVWIHGPQFR